MRVAAGQATPLVVSAGVATLVKRVTWSMLMTKYKILGFSLLLTAVTAVGLVPAAQQARQDRQAAAPQAARPGPAARVGERAHTVHSVPRDYVVEPPDMLLVEVLEALPGRPISGERLVRPDGKISLGFYGEIYVAGQNLNEIKTKVVNHLRKTLSDEALGLIVHDSKTGRDLMAKPEDSDRVFVDVTKINSKNYYVLGDVAIPGRLPLTGKQTVLDAINLAGGLKYEPKDTSVVLYRPDPTHVRSRALPINIKEVLLGDDTSTNYRLEPGDRLVVQLIERTEHEAPALARTTRGTGASRGSFQLGSAGRGIAWRCPDAARSRSPPVADGADAQENSRKARASRTLSRIIERGSIPHRRLASPAPRPLRTEPSGQVLPRSAAAGCTWRGARIGQPSRS